jgi:hypothetical protein
MRAALIFSFARLSRWPMVPGATRKAEAMRAASMPSTVCSISGVCMAGAIAGWAQTNISFSRSSGKASPSLANPAASSASASK